MQIAMNSKVRYFLRVNSPYSGPLYFNVWELTGDLRMYLALSSYVTVFYVHFKNSDIIISPSTSYTADSFYPTFFASEGLDAAAWRAQYLDPIFTGAYLPMTTINTGANPHRVIPYLYSLNADPATPFNANILLYIDAGQISSLLERVRLFDDSWVYIVDRNGQVITSVHDEERNVTLIDIPAGARSGFFRQLIYGQDMIITYTTSSSNGWRYVAVTPTSSAMQPINSVYRTIWLIVLGSLVLGTIVAFYLLSRNLRPITEVIRSLQTFYTPDSSGNEFDFMKGSIANLIKDNKLLRQDIDQQKPLMKQVLLTRLVQGQIYTSSEFIQLADKSGFRHMAPAYVALVIRIIGYVREKNEDDQEELDILRIGTVKVLENMVGARGLVNTIDSIHISLLLLCESPEKDSQRIEAGHLAIRINEHLDRYYAISTMVGIGTAVREILEISQSFSEARQALDFFSIEKKTGIVQYDDIPQLKGHYVYSVDFESRLIMLIRAGEEELVNNMLTQVYNDNFFQRELSYSAARLLLYDLYGTLIKVSYDVSLDETTRQNIDELEKILEQGDIGVAFADIKRCCLSVCSYINSNKRSHNNDLKAQIIAEIDRSYSDPNFSLYLLGDQFNLSENYLSQFIKEQLGESFSSYLEKLRINEARQRLLCTQDSIKEIALSVGYSNDQSFRRAFKRVTGLSPSYYREQS
jgi:AraC-like DNA-binding protein